MLIVKTTSFILREKINQQNINNRIDEINKTINELRSESDSVPDWDMEKRGALLHMIYGLIEEKDDLKEQLS